MTIKAVPCRAEITIGNLTVSTPYVQSFNVRRSRGQAGTFDASLKVSHEDVADLSQSGEVKIKAGTVSSIRTIFTGVLKAAKISPCFDDPYYVILTVSGHEKIAFLAGKKYTRRCRGVNGLYCTIQSVVRKGLKSGKFAFDREAGHFDIEDGNMEDQQSSTKSSAVSDVGSIEIEKARSSNQVGQVSMQVTYMDPEAGGTGGGAA
jgi:hypothetical protein